MKAVHFMILFNLFFIILMINDKLFMNIDYHDKYYLDYIVLCSRKKYKKMAIDNRINMEICENSDKVGSIRDFRKDIGNNCEPWISRECIYVLDHILPFEGIGLEWSSGSSTIWLSYRIKKVISIENNKKWSNMVKNIIKKRNLYNRTELIWINKDDIDFCNNDKQFISNFYKGKTCFKTYVTTNLIHNITFDFINIDGRARTGCLLRAIKILKKENGILIFDNAERDRYKWSYKYIPSSWTKYDFWYKSSLVKLFISH